MILDWLLGGGPRASTLSSPSMAILEALNATPSYAGKSVTQATAMTIAAVYSATRILSDPLAGLPFRVMERISDTERRPANGHNASTLLRFLFNREQTSAQGRTTMMLNKLIQGNGYAELFWDNAGRLQEIVPIPSAYVTPERETPTSPLRYKVIDNSFGSLSRIVPWRRMWHVANFSFDGIIGMSTISLAKQSFGVALASEHHAASQLANGAKLSGILSHPGELKEEIREGLEESIAEKYGGPENVGKWLVLEEGMKFDKVQMTSTDLQFIESRKHDVAEVARWFRVPLHMLAEHIAQPRANMEHQGIEFLSYSLAPHIVCFEQTGMRDLLRSDERVRYYIAMNVAGLLRGDVKTRFQAFALARQWGWLSVNDIRALEDLNPIDGGDEYLRPLNMVPVGEDEEDPKPAAPPPMRLVGAKSGPTARELALVEDAAQRVVTRETRAVRKALEKNGAEDLGDWSEEWYGRHVDFVARALAVPQRAAEAHVTGQKNALVAAARGGAEHVEKLLTIWEDSLPSELASEVHRYEARQA